MDTPRIFLAAPTARSAPIRDALCGAAPGCRVEIMSGANSLLACNFNLHWCAALNSRADHGWTEFAMVHEDVTPDRGYWLRWLIDERRRVGADILSVVLAARDDSGLTSTALCSSADRDARATRLTLKQIRTLPPTFDVDDCHRAGLAGDTLLVNSGLWICDFTKPWVERIHFEIRDEIRRRSGKSGRFEAFCWPEDWNFSRRARELGLSVYATSGLVADHAGFRNDGDYGQEIDERALELARA